MGHRVLAGGDLVTNSNNNISKLVLIFLVLLFFAIILGQFASSQTYADYYEDFDGVSDSDFTAGSVGASYKLNTTNGYWFSTSVTSGYPKYFNTSTDWNGQGNVSAVFFVHVDSTTGDFYKQVGFVWSASDGSPDGASLYFRSTSNNRFCYGDVNSMACTGDLGNDVSLTGNTWYKVFLDMWNQTNGSFMMRYRVATVTDSGDLIDKTKSFPESLISGAKDITVVFIDKQGAGSSSYIDDVFLQWRITPAVGNFSITAKDYNNVNINNFSATVNGTEFSTTTGDIDTGILLDSGILDVTLHSAIDENGAFFNLTHEDINTSEDYIFTGLYQSEISFIATEKYTNDTISSPSFYNGASSLSDPYLTMAGSEDITVSATNYYNLTTELNFTALENATRTIEGMYKSILNVTAVIDDTNATINAFTIHLIQDDLGIDEEQNAAAGYIEFNVLDNYTYNLTFTAVGYASNNTLLMINASFPTENITFRSATFNSIQISIYNGTTSNLLLQNVTITTISNLTSFENLTNTGGILLDLLFPNYYELRFASSGFNPTSKFLTVVNDSSQTTSVYMISNTSSEIQVIQVVDTANQPIEGAVVWLQKEIIGGSDLYLTVQEAVTDFDGKTTVWVDRDTTIFYRFAVIYQGEARPIQPSGNLYTSKTSFIPGITETVQLIIELEEAASVDITQHLNIITNMYFNSTNNNTVYFNWIDGANTVEAGTLVLEAKYYDNKTMDWEFIMQTALSGSSGELNFTLIPINNTIYRATGYLNFTGYAAIYEQEQRSYGADIVTERNFGLFLAVFVLIAVALLTVNFGALVSSLFTFGSLFLLSVFQIVDIPITLITTLIAIAIILFAKMKAQNE